MEGLSAICGGLVSIEEDDLGNPISYSKHHFCLDNLKDLLRFLRRDDPEKRDVFKQVCKWNIVSKDLIPIIEQFQDDRNLVLNAVKVLVFLTMPVEPTSHDIPQQLDHLWGLKASITSSDIVPVIVSLLETPLENLEREEFTEEDWKLVQLVFTLFRNLLAILDIPPHQKAGGSATQFLYLRDKLLEQLFHENVMDLILVLTHHVGGSCKYLCNDNLLLLEILHYIFTGQEPELIAKAYKKDSKIDGDSKTTNSLKSMMEKDKKKLAKLRTMSCYAQLSGIFTRPTMNGSKTLLKGNPCTSSTEALLKSHKVHRGPQKKAAWDHGSLPSTDDKVLELLHDFINQLLSGGYNVLMQSIRQDIEKEHHTIQNNDVVVFFQVAQFVTSFQHHKLLSKEVETDSSEVSRNNQTDNTLFRGNKCGPIAATMNESMFQLVVSKWHYAYDGLKETNDYNYVSAAGSIMKTMIRILDSVLKVSPEDSKEPQTARVLLYKLFYDQTDEGMTRFLLNQIKAFDNHKQPKSDLVDLVETIYVVIRLIENLQARGTLRVSRKSWKKRTKRKADDKSEKTEKPVDVPAENVVSSCEPPSDSALFSEKLNNTVSDEKDEDTETAKKMPEENNDGMYDENDDSSHDEQITATKEVDFNVSSLVSALASNAIIKNLCWLLKFYKGNSLRTNHYVICLLKKICDDLELSPMLYQLSYLSTFYMIINEQKSSPSKEFENINEFLTTLVRRMMRKMKSQPLLFIEVLFLKTRNECHSINCESIEKEVGKLKIEGEKYGSSHYGDIGSTQEKGWAHRNLADALGDDEVDFVEEHRYNVEINNESFELESEDAPFVANDGSRNQRNYGSDRNMEPGSEEFSKRRKSLVLTEEVESKIKELYEIHKNDRHCSRLISEALDLDGKFSPAQVSNKLRQLGLKIQPKKRMFLSVTPNNFTEEEGHSSLSPYALNENSAVKPLHTRKRVRAFSEAQEMTIRDLFERFKDEKKCSHMIANALDNDGKYTAAQISRKLKQLGLQIPKRKKSGVNTQLVDEGEDSDNETLLNLKKRCKNENTGKDNHEVDVINKEENSSDGDSDDVLLSSIASKKLKTGRDNNHEVAEKNIDGKSSGGDSDDEFLHSAIAKTRRQSNSGCEQGDTPNVAVRDSDRSPETGANNPDDFTLNETSEKQLEVMVADDENEVTHRHLEDDLSDKYLDSEDEATPITLPKDAVLRRKAKSVIDFDDDDD